MKHWKRIMAVLCLACMTLLLTLPVHATAEQDAAHAYPTHADKCGVYDMQEELDSYTLTALSQLVQDTAKELQMYVAVIIVGPETPFSSDGAVARYADDAYDAMFNVDYGVNTDGVLLLVNNSTQYDYISTCGMGQFYYSNSSDNDRIQAILDAMHSDLVAGNYDGIVSTFCQQLTYNRNADIPEDYYTYDPDTGTYLYLDKSGNIVEADRLPYDWGSGILISCLVGGVVGVIAYFAIKSQYKFKASASPTNYICGNKTNMQVQNDTFLREYTTKTKIETSSGGGGSRSGGGSSHRSSGGSSHGGGGRHR